MDAVFDATSSSAQIINFWGDRLLSSFVRAKYQGNISEAHNDTVEMVFFAENCVIVM